MVKILLHWFLVALSILVTARIVPGVRVQGLGPALIAAFVLGALNVIVKPILVILTLPITVLTLGLFLLVINATIVSLAGYLVPGFWVRGFWAAIFASIIISLCSTAADRMLDKFFRAKHRTVMHEEIDYY